MVTLLAFGLAHVVFLWNGDILHVYAGLRTGLDPRPEAPGPLALGDRRLLRPPAARPYARDDGQRREAAHRRAALRRGLDELRIYTAGRIRPPRIDKDKATGALKPPLRVTGSGTYPQTVADRNSDLIFQYRHGTYGWFSLTAASTLLIGFIAGRRRFFEDIPGHLPLIRKITWWCGGIGLVVAVAIDRLLDNPRRGRAQHPRRRKASPVHPEQADSLRPF